MMEMWDEDATSKDDLIGRIELEELLPFANNKGELEIEMTDEGEKPSGKMKFEMLFDVKEEEFEEEVAEAVEEREITPVVGEVEETKKSEINSFGTFKVKVLSCDV
jgi:glycerophosphoryl diester phosphodiesterase